MALVPRLSRRVLLEFALIHVSGPPRTRLRWVPTSGFCFKYGPAFRHHLLAQMSEPPRQRGVPLACQ